MPLDRLSSGDLLKYQGTSSLAVDVLPAVVVQVVLVGRERRRGQTDQRGDKDDCDDSLLFHDEYTPLPITGSSQCASAISPDPVALLYRRTLRPSGSRFVRHIRRDRRQCAERSPGHAETEIPAARGAAGISAGIFAKVHQGMSANDEGLELFQKVVAVIRIDFQRDRLGEIQAENAQYGFAVDNMSTYA